MLDSLTSNESFERLECEVQTHRLAGKFCKIEMLIESFGWLVDAIKTDGDEGESMARFVAVD